MMPLLANKDVHIMTIIRYGKRNIKYTSSSGNEGLIVHKMRSSKCQCQCQYVDLCDFLMHPVRQYRANSMSSAKAKARAY